jgi:hypothetical protein
MSESARIAVLANHQQAGLTAALRALLPGATVLGTDITQLTRDRAARAATEAAVAGCSHIISQDMSSLYGALATSRLRRAGKPVALLPRFRFAGFHPDTVAVTLDGARLAGPTGATHSRLAIAGYLGGLTAPQTTDLFNGLVFGRLGYYGAYAEQHALLLAAFSAYGYDLAPYVDAWRHAGCFMLDSSHPRMRVLLDIARLLCLRLGITPETDTVHERDLPPPPAPHATHPLFPDIAARLGVSPEGTFRGPRQPGRPPTLFSLDAFVRSSFAAYRRAPLAALRGVDGMPAALAALGLAEADFGRAAARVRLEAASLPDDTVFLSWHGKLLGIETVTGTLVQTAPWPACADSTEAVVRMTLPVDAEITSTLAGGTRIAPGSHPGSVCLRQGGRFLSAPPQRMAPRFAASEPGQSELFLPLRRRELAALRLLAGGSWQVAGGGQLPGAMVRLLPGFRLSLGDAMFDLGGIGLAAAGRTVTLTSGDAQWVLRPARGAADAGGSAIDAVADTSGLSEAASPEQFRHWPDHRLHLTGPEEVLHLPLAADDATRVWLYRACSEPAALRLGRQTVAATAMRATGKFLLLSRGAEGSIVDAGGRWAGTIQPEAALPAGVRRAGGGILMSGEAMQSAPNLRGRFCVFYTPRLAEWDDFLLRGALALHILQPLLGSETRLLLPPTLPDLAAHAGFDHMEVLAALGFGGMPALRPAAHLVRVPDVTWLADAGAAGLPAFLLQSFRARVFALHPPAARERRLYVRPAAGRVANGGVVEAFLASHKFEIVTPENLDPASRIAMFGAAEMIVAAHGASLGSLLFCQAGTRVLELSPEAAFRPVFWQVSEKLGLCHAVLPCAARGEAMTVDMQRLRAIFRMLTAMTV